MGFKIGIVGCGQFAACFVPLFKAHPAVDEVVVCDAVGSRAEGYAKRFGLKRVMGGFDDMLASDVDAVAILTQRWLHAPMAIRALRAGKHVYSAVPAAVSVEEMQELADTVSTTGLTYMLGETSYYYGAAVYCREKWRRGAFGAFVYGEGEYLHDMSHGFYEAFAHSGGEAWKRTAGFPPMLYPTHSVSIILSVTGARATHVSCLGYRDAHDDGVFRPDANDWANPFSNQTALFRTSDGGMLRVNEFRRVGASHCRSVRMSLFGTAGSFEEQPGKATFTTVDHRLEDATGQVACGVVGVQEWLNDRDLPEPIRRDFSTGFAASHERERRRLPESFHGLPNGHEGSHQFLVDDFARAVVAGALPPNHVWAAARYNLPGLIAHASSLREGESLPVPDLGWPEKSALMSFT